MTETIRSIMLKVPQELDSEIENASRGRYRSKQEFILECIRKELQATEKARGAQV